MKSIVRGNGTMAAIQNIILSVKKFEKGFIQIKLDVKRKIERAKLFGDFFGEGDNRTCVSRLLT